MPESYKKISNEPGRPHQKSFWADYIFILRPMILIPVWTFFLFGAYHGTAKTGLAASPGSLIAGLISFTALLGAAYVINQISDKETDLENDKLFLIPRGIISVKSAWIETGVLIILSFAVAVLYLPFRFIFTLVAGLVLALVYSLEPARLKKRAFFDIAANAVGSGIVNTTAGWIAAGAPLTGLNILIPYPFAVAAVHLVTTLADLEGDRAQGFMTSGIALGRKNGIFLSALLMLIAAALALLTKNRIAFYAAVLSLPFFIVPVLDTGPIRGENAILLPAKTAVVIFSIIAGMIFRLYLPFLVAVVLLTRAYYKRRFGISYPSLR